MRVRKLAGTRAKMTSKSALDLAALDKTVGLERPYVHSPPRRGARLEQLVGTDADLNRDLWRAHHKYTTRIKIDAAGHRQTVLLDVQRTGKKFRAALVALEEQPIALPPELPDGLNLQALDFLLASCREAQKKTGKPPQWRTSMNKLQLGQGKSSALEFLLGSLLPPIFERYYKHSAKLRASDGFADTPFIRFAITVCKQLGVAGRSGAPPSRETIVKACSLYRAGASRRKVSRQAMGK